MTTRSVGQSRLNCKENQPVPEVEIAQAIRLHPDGWLWLAIFLQPLRLQKVVLDEKVAPTPPGERQVALV